MPRTPKSRESGYKLYFRRNIGGEIPVNTLRSRAQREQEDLVDVSNDGACEVEDSVPDPSENQADMDEAIEVPLMIDDGIQPSARNNPGTSSQGCLQRALSQHQSSEAHLQSEESDIEDEYLEDNHRTDSNPVDNLETAVAQPLNSSTPVPSPASPSQEYFNDNYDHFNNSSDPDSNSCDVSQMSQALNQMSLAGPTDISMEIENFMEVSLEQSEENAIPSHGVSEEATPEAAEDPSDISSLNDSDFEDEHLVHDAEMNLSVAHTSGNQELEVEEFDQAVDEDANLLAPDFNVHHFDMLKSHGFSRLRGTDFAAVIGEPIRASVGEIFLNALALCRYHKWGHREKSDLMKFVNSLFKRNVLPDSRYMLDQLFNSQEGLHFYFYCKKCTQFLGELTDEERETLQTIPCPNVSCDEENNDKRVASKLHDVFQPVDDENIIGDLYTGTCYRKFAAAMTPSSEVDKILSFTLSVDGAALFVSSKCSIWPCFLMVNELSPYLRMQNLLIAGLWFGSSKAQMDLYLPPICEHIRSLSVPGFSINVCNNEVWRVRAYLIACCVDSGARGDVQGIHAHRGEFSCSWCLHEGVECEEGGRKFPFLYPMPEERTAASMLRKAAIAIETNSVIQGVKFVPCLASLPHYDNVESQIVEWMHCGAEGNAKTFTLEWKDGPATSPYYIGAPRHLKTIERKIASVKPPLEVRKYLRKASDMGYWTGREWENWLLFYSVPILSGILESRYLHHWVLFVQAAHLLLQCTLSVELLDVAEKLLLEFVAMTEQLYGLFMMRFNVHLLLHLVKNVSRWGCLHGISAFAFEAGNQQLKKVVLAMNGVPHQICRAISEEKAVLFLKNTLQSDSSNKFCENLHEKRIAKITEVGNVKLIGTSFICRNTLTAEEKWLCNRNGIDVNSALTFKKVKKDGITYASFDGNKKGNRSVRNNNSFARLSDKRFVQISSFVFGETSQEIHVLCYVVRCIPHLCPPALQRVDPSSSFLFLVNSIDDDKILIPVSCLKDICVSMEFDGHFLSPMPNVLNMF